MTRPKIVCLCGSSKFKEAFDIANAHETLKGNIVLTMGVFAHSDYPSGLKTLTNDGDSSNKTKALLDELHLQKVDMADEIVVVNFGDYVGQSTKNEIQRAVDQGKPVRFLYS